MAVGPEPHRDLYTISSYKRTINAAILMLAARGRPPAPKGRGAAKAMGLIVVGAAVGRVLGMPVEHWLGTVASQ